jgi:outer membrane biosynthesis protein TonB
MSDYAHKEKKNRIIGISVSLGLHILVLLLFLWVTAWKEPYPPLPEYGIELDIGMDTQGSGNEPVAAQESEEIEETPTEESEEVVENEVEETTEAEDLLEEVSEPADEAVEEAVTNTDSPVKVEDTPTEEVKETPKKEEKQEKKEAPKANPNALFPGDSKSQGETNDQKGDQGNPEGEVDADAMMGPQGGGNGSKLTMSGWKWASPPRPNDPTQQNGKIVFEIRVDNNGEVIEVRTVETTVSQEVVKIYEDEVKKLSFYRTSEGKTAPQSKGTITFLIRSN